MKKILKDGLFWYIASWFLLPAGAILFFWVVAQMLGERAAQISMLLYFAFMLWTFAKIMDDD